MMKIGKKIFKRIFCVLLCLAIVGLTTLLIVNGRVKAVSKGKIISLNSAAELDDIDCIIVLGCQVKPDGSLSHMLRDRVLTGIKLYESGSAPKILMSGDHGQKEYNEVGAMKQYASTHGIESENIFMDHAGFSTYETMYRAKEVFKVKKAIIVTQQYHLYRAVYIANKLGIEAYGVSADLNTYRGQSMRDAREILARFKDFTTCIIKPKPTFLGEAIPINSDGNLTND